MHGHVRQILYMFYIVPEIKNSVLSIINSIKNKRPSKATKADNIKNN